MARGGPLLTIGTPKGLFLLEGYGPRRRWDLSGPFLEGEEINHAVLDPQSGAVYVAANSPWFGSQVAWTMDLGATWSYARENPRFSADRGMTVERLWRIQPGVASRPGVLFAGAAPATLFRSDDSGETWREVRGLGDHPTRGQWFPGAGGLCLHSIVPDPDDPNRMHVAISAAGTFRTTDDGATWAPLNRGVRAEFLPERYPEVGQCVHKLVMAPTDSSRLYQQTHCGTYRSRDGGEEWEEITEGLPADFGFPIAVHPRDPQTVYVLPLQRADNRTPPGGSSVCIGAVTAATHGRRLPAAFRSRMPSWARIARGWRPTISRWRASTSAPTRGRCTSAATRATRGVSSPTIFRRFPRSPCRREDEVGSQAAPGCRCLAGPCNSPSQRGMIRRS